MDSILFILLLEKKTNKAKLQQRVLCLLCSSIWCYYVELCVLKRQFQGQISSQLWGLNHKPYRVAIRETVSCSLLGLLFTVCTTKDIMGRQEGALCVELDISSMGLRLLNVASENCQLHLLLTTASFSDWG